MSVDGMLRQLGGLVQQCDPQSQECRQKCEGDENSREAQSNKHGSEMTRRWHHFFESMAAWPLFDSTRTS